MNIQFAKRMEHMAPSGIRLVNEKAIAMERQGEKVLHFEIGRPDFDTPSYIKNACIKSLKKGDVFYTSNFGDMVLREKIAQYLKKKNVSYEAKEVLVTVGLSEAVFDTLSVLLDEGDEILVPDPVWINYMNVPRLLGAVPVSYNLLEENDYQPDLAELESKITDKTKAIVLITPNNPTGSILSSETLYGIAEIVKKHDILVISDEIYERLLYDGRKHSSIAALSGMKERTVLLNGFSKAYSMTGWRIGYVAAPENVIMQLNKVHQHNTTCAPSFVQKAAIAALTEERDEVNVMVMEYQRRRAYAVAAINSINGISCQNPTGAFYIFINVRSLKLPSAEIASYLLEEEKIALVPGDVFGANGEGYLRMSFAASYENIVEGCQRLAKGIAKLQTLIVQ